MHQAGTTRWRGNAAAAARGVAPFGLLVLAWYLVARARVFPEIFLPPPDEVVLSALEMVRDGTLLVNIGASFGRVLVGVLFSIPLGIALGVAVGLSRPLAEFLEPIVGFFNSLSGIAWLPLAITWFGLALALAGVYVVWLAGRFRRRV